MSVGVRDCTGSLENEGGSDSGFGEPLGHREK